jgi:hypothetical protein
MLDNYNSSMLCDWDIIQEKEIMFMSPTTPTYALELLICCCLSTACLCNIYTIKEFQLVLFVTLCKVLPPSINVCRFGIRADQTFLSLTGIIAYIINICIFK